MTVTTTRSQKLYSEAKKLMPAGVNSPVRAFKAVGGNPIYIKRGKGSRVFDEDGNEYIDYLSSWGPLILGHTHPEVVKRVKSALENGMSYGMPHAGEIHIAELIHKFFPSIEMLRLVNSGTEATMSAIRVARGYTGRPGVVKFEGCYHGHGDCLLAKAGSGAMTFGVPDSLGVPESIIRHTITVPYNDVKTFKYVIKARAREIAAVIVEPVAGNMGVVLPVKRFLEELREQTEKHSIVLIFDEVITGFRIARGGAQELYQIKPDLTTLGKILGGGFPIGAYGGKREIMEKIAPLGGVYQAGTLSGNPVAVAAGTATLEVIDSDREFYEKLDEKGRALTERMDEILNKKNIPHTINRVGSMFTLFFSDTPVTDYLSAQKSDTTRYARFFHGALERGLYFAPSQFEAAFLSSAHMEKDLEDTIKAMERLEI